MKKNYIAKNCLLGVALALAFASCAPKAEKAHRDVGKLEIDSSLRALVQPTNQRVVANASVVQASYEPKLLMAEATGVVNYDSRNETTVASRVAGRLEKLYIKYNYQPVKKGQLIMEVYAPSLAAAQQELIYLSQLKSDQHLLEKAKQRLLLLGMSAQSVQQVLRTQKVNHRIPVYSPTDGYILEKSLANNATMSPAAAVSTAGGGGAMSGMSSMGAGNAPASAQTAAPQVENSAVLLREGQYVNADQALFTIYKSDQLLAEFALTPELAPYVKKGSKLAFYKTSNKAHSFQTAKVGLVQPLIKNGESFTSVRIYMGASKLKAGELLTAKIPLWVKRSFWLPKSAVLSMGAKKIVFKQEGSVFVPKNITVGLEIDDMVQIKEDVSGFKFAKNAAYLVDSESFIKTNN
jgi:multidrug efflux pump subunit AcrA (membrane-fusion protein)